ncbi:hypothetical protein KM915_27645 [Cytobacillus oceanisediminis]|nr:hypothetical protein [Cytobacillus oceanisediminis]
MFTERKNFKGCKGDIDPRVNAFFIEVLIEQKGSIVEEGERKKVAN